MKKYKLKEWVKNLLGILLFYSIIVGGVIAVNYRVGQIKSANEPRIQIAQNQSR